MEKKMEELRNKLESAHSSEIKDLAFRLNTTLISLYNDVSGLSQNSLKELFYIEPNLIALAVSFGRKNERERAEELYQVMLGKDFKR